MHRVVKALLIAPVLLSTNIQASPDVELDEPPFFIINIIEGACTPQTFKILKLYPEAQLYRFYSFNYQILSPNEIANFRLGGDLTIEAVTKCV